MMEKQIKYKKHKAILIVLSLKVEKWKIKYKKHKAIQIVLQSFKVLIYPKNIEFSHYIN